MNRRRTIALSCMALAAAVLSAPTAHAYVASGFTWSSLPVQYEVNTSSSTELGRDTTLSVVEASYASWAEPSCSGFRAMFAGETTSSWRSGDRTNTLLWIYDPGSRPRELGGSSTIGVTLSIFSGSEAIDGDILFNGIDHDWTTSPTRGGQVDAQSIITHETGHQLGLNHSPFMSATMYAAYLGGTGSRSLSEDDITGVCDLYPSGVAPECSSDAECGAGRVCRGGRCQDAPPPGSGGVGDPCSMPEDCAGDTFCVGPPDGGDPFCTRMCAGDCPSGWSCQTVGFSGGGMADICLPGAGPTPGTGAFGDPCESNQDCSTNICVSDGSSAFCTQLCTDATGCPSGGMCVPLMSGGGACVPGSTPPPPTPPTPPPTPPTPPPPGDGGVTPPPPPADTGPRLPGMIGDACDAPTACASGHCGRYSGETFCTSLCAEATPCTSGYSCSSGICVPDRLLEDDGGCGCRVAGAKQTNAGWATGILLALAACVAAWRARRR
ncbi:MAG: matrixin family metalloprotease [Deltaproteobacteria bacterium]|nr:matrixin family metalloprotease [Deltaproteobacteria bacterium]